jgi:LEA14-like dessication related protein
MKRVSSGAAVLVAVLLFSSSCATAPHSAGLSVSVTNVLPTQASLLETSAALTLRFVNEGPAPLHLGGGVHRLYLNDSYVGRAVTNERLTVPGLGTATQTITVYLENLTLIRKVSELSNSAAPRIGYRLESKLHPIDERGFGNIATSTSGELDLSGFTNLGSLPLAPTSAPTGR